MGQAKIRGTRDERVALAIAENKRLAQLQREKEYQRELEREKLRMELLAQREARQITSLEDRSRLPLGQRRGKSHLNRVLITGLALAAASMGRR